MRVKLLLLYILQRVKKANDFKLIGKIVSHRNIAKERGPEQLHFLSDGCAGPVYLNHFVYGTCRNIYFRESILIKNIYPSLFLCVYMCDG